MVSLMNLNRSRSNSSKRQPSARPLAVRHKGCHILAQRPAVAQAGEAVMIGGVAKRIGARAFPSSCLESLDCLTAEADASNSANPVGTLKRATENGVNEAPMTA
jgi:hypothetical protein